MRNRYDAGSKWLIETFATELLQLAGVQPGARVKPVASELVQSRQLPDGLFEVTLPNESRPVLHLLEINTYSYVATASALLDDVLLAYLDRRVIPEVVTITLHDRGNVRVSSSIQLASPLGSTGLEARWRVVNLWEVNAHDFLPLNDPGFAPWIPLMKIDGPPEPVLQQCRDAIDTVEAPGERANLLGVTRILAELRFDEQLLERLFKVERNMIESPALKRWFRETEIETRQTVILESLEAKFGSPVPADVSAAVRVIQDENRLKQLLPLVYSSLTLDAFRQVLTAPQTPATN
jgi:hypothetical protein